MRTLWTKKNRVIIGTKGFCHHVQNNTNQITIIIKTTTTTILITTTPTPTPKMKFCKNLQKIVDISDPAWAPYWPNYKMLKVRNEYKKM